MSGIRRVVVVFVLLFVSFTGPAGAMLLSVELQEALAVMHAGGATEYQRALLFKHNDIVNAAALNGELSNELYQSAQRDFAKINERLGAEAAAEAGAQFRVQSPKEPGPKIFQPGTDSDYITVVDRKEQIQHMQEAYNRRINEMLANAGVPSEARGDWHNTLDTDFMADPSRVSEQEFREIAELNNDAYARRNAAAYEAASRSGGTITPELVRDYVAEMQDFQAKKEAAIREAMQNPSVYADELKQAELHRLLAQEQKYISRMEAAVNLLRAQEGLPPLDPRWLAKEGAIRASDNYLVSAVAGSVSHATMNTAIEDLATTLAEIAAKNPGGTAAADIAILISRLPAADQGRIIEKLGGMYGSELAQEVAAAAREQHAARSAAGGADDSFRALGSADELVELSLAQRAARGGLKLLEGVGVLANGIDVAMSVAALRDYFLEMQIVLDPHATDAEVDAAYKKMAQYAENLIETGTMGALFEAYPPLAAAYGAWIVSYEGTRWVLRSTETGQAINRAAVAAFEAAFELEEELRVLLGEDSTATKLTRLEQEILERYIKGVRDGTIVLDPGVTLADIVKSLRNGEPQRARDAMLTRDTSGGSTNCLPALWTGTWASDWGVMQLSASSSFVSGIYDYDEGNISGSLDETGCTMTGKWTEVPSRSPPNDAGGVVLTMTPGGTSFSGVWGYGESTDSGTWSATKVE
jgi:hypothetical protein